MSMETLDTGHATAAVMPHLHHEIHFTVDGEPCETRHRELTPNQIICEFGHKDPNKHYLLQLEGHHEPISFKGKGDDPIQLQDGDRFQIISTGPTPVS